jgi:hypothetical protein
MPPVKNVGKPCAGEPHARFDGRGLETEATPAMVEAKAARGNPGRSARPTAEPFATAPAPDPPRSLSLLLMVFAMVACAGSGLVFSAPGGPCQDIGDGV